MERVSRLHVSYEQLDSVSQRMAQICGEVSFQSAGGWAHDKSSNARGPFWSVDPLLERTSLTMRLRPGTSKVYLGEVEPYNRR